jgi:hypothetical protein
MGVMSWNYVLTNVHSLHAEQFKKYVLINNELWEYRSGAKLFYFGVLNIKPTYFPSLLPVTFRN